MLNPRLNHLFIVMCSKYEVYQVHHRAEFTNITIRPYMHSQSPVLIQIKLIQYVKMSKLLHVQQSEDVATNDDVKMEDNPAYDTTVL